MRLYHLPLLLLLLAAAALSSRLFCPSDWLMYGEKCYKFIDSEMTWHDAEEACGLIHPGSTLASVHDIEQNAFLSETVAGYDIAWLGLRRASSNGSWNWTDGSSFDFTFWNENHPQDDDDQCAELCNRESEWCSFLCHDGSHERSFICQFDA